MVADARIEPARHDAVEGMSPAQIVDQITTLNPSVGPDFLSRFRPESLATYLRRLLVAQEPRAEAPGWIRTGELPAITRWAPAV